MKKNLKLEENGLILRDETKKKNVMRERRCHDREKGSCCNRRWKLCKHNQLLERERIAVVQEYRAVNEAQLEKEWQTRHYEKRLNYWKHNSK